MTTAYQTLDPRAIFSIELPKLEYLVDGIIVAGSFVILPAREKSGKGWLALDIACSVVLGEPFLERAVIEGPVLYFAFEESLRTLRERLGMRLGDRLDVPLHMVLLDGSISGQAFQLENFDDLSAVASLFAEVQPVLAVFDPLREMHSGREDHSDDMAVRLRALRQLAHQHGTTVIVTHHTSKGSGSSRGSTSIRAAFDDEVAFTRLDDTSETEIRGTLKIEGRNLRKQILNIMFDVTTGRWNTTNGPDIVIDPGLRGRILKLLEDSNEWLSAKDIADRLPGVSLKTIQNKMSEICKESPCPIVVDGQPKRGRPRRFHSLDQRMDLFPAA